MPKVTLSETRGKKKKVYLFLGFLKQLLITVPNCSFWAEERDMQNIGKHKLVCMLL